MKYDFDPYVILGVAQSASTGDVERAYRNLEARLRPSDNPYQTAALVQYEVIRAAFEILTDSIQRKKYDDYARKEKEVQEKNGAYFTMRVTPSKRAIVPLGEEQVIYLLAEINAAPQAVEMMGKHDSRINLTLVLDHSKSMEDENRMEKVKAAAQAIITELTNNDVISIVAFNDRATTIIPATRISDKMALRARISMIQPKGGTEIYQGLAEGVQQNRQYLDPRMVNHIILLTDGRTYGDEDKCLQLAQQISKEGISVSSMGLGTDWNDTFLDEIATLTGGTSTFIRSVNMVHRFMDEQVRNLSNAFAERLQLTVVPDPDVQLEMAFKLSPSPQPLKHEGGTIPLASLPPNRPVSILLQFQLPAHMTEGYRTVARLVSSGDLMLQNATTYRAVSDLSLEVNETPPQTDGPPNAIVDALSKLTLYRMQEQAQEAMDRGDIEEATRQLQYLATRLIDIGQVDLGRQAMAEAQHVAQTRAFSNDASGKTIKYGTRALIQPGMVKDALTMLLSDD